MESTPIISCVYCESNKILKDGKRTLISGEQQQKYLCASCYRRFCLNPKLKKLSKLEKHFIDKQYKSRSTAKIAKVLSRTNSSINRYIRKFHPNSQRDCSKATTFNLNLKDELGEFMGAFAGDGNLYCNNGTYRVTISLNYLESDYAYYLSNLIYRLFNKVPNMWLNKKDNVINIIFFGKRISSLIKDYLYFKEGKKTKTIRLNQKIDSYSVSFRKGFVRGLVSTDGYIGYKPKIEFSSISSKLSKQYAEIVNAFGIRCKVYKYRKKYRNRFYYIFPAYTLDRKSIVNFYNKIGMHESLRVNKLENIINDSLSKKSY